VPRDEEFQRLHGALLPRDFILLLHRDFRISCWRSGPFTDSFSSVRGCAFGHGDTPFAKNLIRIKQAHRSNEQRRCKEENATFGISDHDFAVDGFGTSSGSAEGSAKVTFW
jgi:hypothetical protein